MEKLRIIVGGYIGLYPTGGATWDYIQYPLGLKLLGHDVYYIEDTMQYPVFQESEKSWDDASICVSYLKNVMEGFGFSGKWAYRDIASGQSFGMSDAAISELCSTADVLINISCSTYMRDEYLKIPKRVLIDSDPMFTQIQYALELSGERKTSTGLLLNTHNYLFSFGENIGEPDCLIPTFGLNWLKTRQPICLEWWKPVSITAVPAPLRFSTILNWSGQKQLIFNDQSWGQKDVEFEKYLHIPDLFPEYRFEAVINPPLNSERSFNPDNLKAHHWHIFHPKEKVNSFKQYASFVKDSSAEFSVAKETYVKSKSGWFSCRSACYLAAGKPVIAQDTGWSKYIPAGSGLFAFDNMDAAAYGIGEIAANWKKNAKIAVEIADLFFDSNKVLSDLLGKLN